MYIKCNNRIMVLNNKIEENSVITISLFVLLFAMEGAGGE